MSSEKSRPGRELERRVADAYRAMGARTVWHDVELAGNQIDVYVEMEPADRSLHRIALEVKNWRRTVGIDVINKFASVVKNLRDTRLVDEGVVVSASGFSKQARNAAQIHGIRLLETADLVAMTTGPTVESADEQGQHAEALQVEQDNSEAGAASEGGELEPYQVKLRQVLETRFDEGELRTLCFDLRVDYDDLRGEGKADKARELVAYLERRERLSKLVEKIKELRQDITSINFLEVVEETTPKSLRDEEQVQGEGIPAKLRMEHVSRVRFVNREYELRRICTLNGAQFALIDAPAGYGKSHLLQEIRRQLCGLVNSGTRCALVEFSDRLALQRQVLDAICQQMDISPSSVDSVDDLSSELIAKTERSEDLAQGLTMVLLLFDGIDQIPMEEVKVWLVRDLIAGLNRGLDAAQSGIKLRAVLAGRFVASEWDVLGKRHGLKFLLLPLSPFSRDIVEEALRLKAREVGRDLEPPACSAMARGIVRATGGHPRCMSQLIDRIAEKRFGVNYEGPENYFDRIQAEILKGSVRPVMDMLVEKLDDRMSKLLLQISVFRRFDQRILDILINSGEIEGFASGEEALASLNATALIAPPGIVEAEKRYEHMHTDRIARRLLALAMKAENPGQYSRLNAVAWHVFRAWLDGTNIEAVPREGPPVYAGALPNKPKDHLQVALVQEYLYHYLQSVETLDEQDLEQETRHLYDELDSSLGVYDIPNQRGRLRDALKTDWELEDRIYYLAGGEEFGEALWRRFLGWACGPP